MSLEFLWFNSTYYWCKEFGQRKLIHLSFCPCSKFFPRSLHLKFLKVKCNPTNKKNVTLDWLNSNSKLQNLTQKFTNLRLFTKFTSTGTCITPKSSFSFGCRFVTSMAARRTHLFLVSSNLLKKNAFTSEEMTLNLAKLKSNPF